MNKRLLLSLTLLAFCFSGTAYAQGNSNAKTGDANSKAVASGAIASPPATAITATTAPIDMARAALAAQGGDKFRTLKSMVLKGSVDL